MKYIAWTISIARITLIGLLILHTKTNNPVTRPYLGFGAILCFTVFLVATIVKHVKMEAEKETESIFKQYGEILECIGFVMLLLCL